MGAVRRLARPQGGADALATPRVAVDDLAHRAVGQPLATPDDLVQPFKPLRGPHHIYPAERLPGRTSLATTESEPPTQSVRSTSTTFGSTARPPRITLAR